MTSAWKKTDRERGKEWFATLNAQQRNMLGDAFVLGTFDHRDWGFENRPSAQFLNGADDARIAWELNVSLGIDE